jgi:hypothetical protein
MTPTVAIIVDRTWLIAHPDQRPAPTPDAFVAEVQVEADTCGLHALNTVYRAYGLDPAAERLRARLGVDIDALVWLPGSTGTLQPDVCMVLAQDHFHTRTLRPGDVDAWDALRGHLATGHPALLLIRRRETDGLHWVVATEAKMDGIWIVDSLAADAYAEPREFLAERVVSIIAMQPAAGDSRPASSVGALVGGSIELLASIPRM